MQLSFALSIGRKDFALLKRLLIIPLISEARWTLEVEISLKRQISNWQKAAEDGCIPASRESLATFTKGDGDNCD